MTLAQFGDVVLIVFCGAAFAIGASAIVGMIADGFRSGAAAARRWLNRRKP